jgi:hypothetical protein
MKILKHKILLIPLVCILILLFFFVKGCLLPIAKRISEKQLTEKEINIKRKAAYNEYTNLLSEETQKKIRLSDSYITKSKYPFLTFNYDSKFELGIYKLKIKKDTPLSKLIVIEKKDEEVSPDVVYEGYGMEGDFRFRISSEYDSIAEMIYLTYYDSLLRKTYIGDSIINYDLSGTNFSTRYKLNGVNDIVFSNSQTGLLANKSTRQNISISLYKKGSNVFLIFIYPYEPRLEIGDLLLLRLLNLNNKESEKI